VETILALVAGVGGLAWLLWFHEAEAVNLADRLDKTLPPRLAQWARELAAAAQATKPAELDLWTWATTLAGLMDRESNGGEKLRPRGARGTGDGGHGLGLMQLDDRFHPGLKEQPELWGNAAWNTLTGAGELADRFRRAVEVAALAPSRRLEYALAAYNADAERVFLGAGDPADNPDVHTTGGDYSADVLARAEAFAATTPEAAA